MAKKRANAPVPRGYSTGLIPRDYRTHPVGCMAFAPAFPDSELLPESEWPARLAYNRANKCGLLDLREANYEVLKSLDQDGLGLCLMPGTQVRLAGGTDAAIESLAAGSVVLTAEGRAGTVTELMRRHFRGELVGLGFGYGPALWGTPEHPVLTRTRGYVPLSELTLDDDVSYRCSGGWARARDLERRPFDGEVFNIEVEGDHSYVANGVGVHNCWAFSSSKAVMYLRALMNASALRLSAWYVAGMIKGWRDQGGWGAASLEFIVKNGIPAESYCPSYKSSYATPETAANAALHKVTEWWDGSDNPATAQKQLISTLLRCMPCVVDLNDMGHSMCAIDVESLNPPKIIYDNSWGEAGGDKGLYRGTGARARPDGLVIPRVSIPSPA